MQSVPRLTQAQNVDAESDCLIRFVTGATDLYYPHTHEFYEVFLTLSGTVTHRINGKTQLLPEGSLVFIRPDDTHGYCYEDQKSKETAYVNLAFGRATAEQLFAYLSDGFPSDRLLFCEMPPTVLLSPSQKELLFSRICDLNLVHWNDKSAVRMRMRVLLAELFSRYFCELPDAERQKMPSWLTRLRAEMERPEHFIAGLGRMVELSGKTREHLCRTFRKHCGITATEWINDLRINYAANLLVNSNTAIIDICFGCGFQSMSYFYRIFLDIQLNIVIRYIKS